MQQSPQAWPFTEFPEWSVWSTLVLLGVYGNFPIINHLLVLICSLILSLLIVHAYIDLCAVLAPFGPLKYIIERGDSIHRDPLPGLMYKGSTALPNIVIVLAHSYSIWVP
jgi:hypothetical protein